MTEHGRRFLRHAAEVVGWMLLTALVSLLFVGWKNGLLCAMSPPLQRTQRP